MDGIWERLIPSRGTYKYILDAVRKTFKFYFNSEVDNCFYVTSQKGITSRFPVCEQGEYEGLYMMDTKKQVSHTFNVRKEIAATTIEGYTARQVTRAKKVKELYHNLHIETVPNLKV